MKPLHRDFELAQMAEHFFGDGRWDAPFWFIGPEAGMAKLRHSLERRYWAWKELNCAPLNIWRLSFTKSSFAVSTLFIKAEKSIGELGVPVSIGESKGSIVAKAAMHFLETLRPDRLKCRRKLRQQFLDRIL
jgi:hypothetical protein